MQRFYSLGVDMDSDELREKLLTAESLHLRDQIISQLCRWHRCRDDGDLRLALRTVKELVSIEDNALGFPSECQW